jgi:dipeptide/tripeptide permease
MSSRGLLALALLVPAVILERTAYYAARSVMMQSLVDASGSYATAARTVTAATTLSFVVSLLAGALALGIGPRATAAIGALVAALGSVVVATDAARGGGVLLIAVGAGIFRPCPWAAAAEIVSAEDGSDGTLAPSPRRFAAVTAITVLLYAGVNLGSLVAPMLARSVTTASSQAPAFGFAAVLQTLAFFLVAGAAAIGFMGEHKKAAHGAPIDPYRTATSPAAAHGIASAPSSSGRGIAGLAILAVPTMLYAGAASMSFPMQASWTAHTSALLSINPFVVVVTSIFVAGMWIAAAALRWSLAPLTVWGIGLAIFGAGLLPTAIGVKPGAPHDIYVLGALITGMGETGVGPVGSTYAALAVRSRAATFVVACFSLTSALASWMFARLSSSPSQWTILLALGTICLATGIAFARFGRRMHRLFFDPPVTRAAPGA